MPLDYASAPLARPQIGLRFCLVALGGGVSGFVLWCALDFVRVRFAPQHIHSFEWLELLFPFAVGPVGVKVLREDSSPRVGLAIVAAVAASIVAVMLILFFGIPFHFSIGGKL